ncbi:MAG: radical SAM protein [Bacteroidales bacterium]|nr:radical SAM protein [Bacteroidales bacterium]
MAKFQIPGLISGGLITNYFCTSKCRHCLYACSPKWGKKYISTERARMNFRIVKSFGCNSVHIGGGEPMLRPMELIRILKIAQQEGVRIDYVETNSSWFNNEETAIEQLTKLKNAGLNILLVSISPFHNEHIPFIKTKGVVSACNKVGINIFPWIQEFYPEVDSFNDRLPHSPEEYKIKFGNNYFKNIPNRYWMHFGGRAIETYKDFLPLKPLERILNSASGCSELTDTSHFHIDLFGNYIPGLCSGFAISVEDIGEPLDPKKYPVLNILYFKGIKGFMEYAILHFDFQAEKLYLNKCHLCLYIRKYLALEKKEHFDEFQPKEYYYQL